MRLSEMIRRSQGAPPPPPPAPALPSPTDGSRPAPVYRSPDWKRPKHEPKWEDLQAE